MKKLILSNPLAPGDVLVSTCAFRDLHKAYPGEYQTDFRVPSGCEQIFENSPYITKILDNDPDVQKIRLDYPDIHESGWSGRPFVTAHTLNLAQVLGREIPHTSLKPDIHFSQDERLWPSPLLKEHGYTGKYWIINAGVKDDVTLKYYHRYQEVVDALAGKIQFVQVGQIEHNHPPLSGVFDMRGKTNLRELFRLSLHAEGSVNAVSLQMVIMAALQKPCVVVAGAREAIRWQMSPNHRFLAVNGSIECALYDGCWKATMPGPNAKPDKYCVNPVEIEGVGRAPLCMDMIRAEDVVRAVELYYVGKVLHNEKEMSHV